MEVVGDAGFAIAVCHATIAPDGSGHQGYISQGT